MTEVREVRVSAGDGERDYSVLLGPGLLHRLPSLVREAAPGVRRWAVVSDDHVGPLHARTASEALKRASLDGTLLLTPSGESQKTRARWAELTDGLLEAGFGRDAGIVAVGGGVVGDLAGFVAATYMRGIPVVQVPTSLLAMIDASVGGKTGVDTPAGKNLVGAFHPPSVVVVDPEAVSTLPREERSQGLVEAVKHGAILDDDYGAAVAEAAGAVLAGDPVATLEVVHRSVQLKAGVVSRDEREGGLREILNFGHTVGHGLERVHDFGLPHGTAVARGMLWEARLGEARGVTEPGTRERLRAWLECLELPLRSEAPQPGSMIRALQSDKKVRDGAIRVVLLARTGEVARTANGRWAHPVSGDEILAAGNVVGS